MFFLVFRSFFLTSVGRKRIIAVIVFGGRILNNFSIIRRDIMDKAQAQRRKIRKQNIATNKTIKTDLEAEQEEIDNDIL